MQPGLLEQRQDVSQDVGALREAKDGIVGARPLDKVADRPEDKVERRVVALERVRVVPGPPAAVEVLVCQRHLRRSVGRRRVSKDHGLHGSQRREKVSSSAQMIRASPERPEQRTGSMPTSSKSSSSTRRSLFIFPTASGAEKKVRNVRKAALRH